MLTSIVGFSLSRNLPAGRTQALLDAQRRITSSFPHLHVRTLSIGESRLEVWGHGRILDRIHTSNDGTVLALVGSPHGNISTREAAERLDQDPERFALPWNGRTILLRISGNGRHWTMWNDWAGSIPVFHARAGAGHVASTLEPAVVAAARFPLEDARLPAILSLLINGHLLSDWTFYEGMSVVPRDSVAEWHDAGFCSKALRTVRPSADRWETGWDDLVDEMHALAHEAVADVIRTRPRWILPLSSGLDSRLIAAVAADVGADVHAVAWGEPDSTDVVYSRDVARTLGLPWKRIDLGADYLRTYTRRWADIFGSSMHFHGMYQMAFLDAIANEPEGPVLSGFLGDVLAGDDVVEVLKTHNEPGQCQLYGDWYVHWTRGEARALLKGGVDQAIQALADEFRSELDSIPGARFQKWAFLSLENRQRFFTYFQSALCDYWRGAGTPFLTKAYARFCMSLPRAALDNRRLLSDVFRRYYPRLATIPGTYGDTPYVVTGRYLLLKRLSQWLPAALRRGSLGNFMDRPLRMDFDCVQAHGWSALWPIREAWERLPRWLNLAPVELAFRAAMADKTDVRPLRKLQSVQTLAYRLLEG